MRGFSEILGLWPSLRSLAGDIGQPYYTVTSWKRRGSVRAQYWPAILRSAQARQLPVTEQDLLRAAQAEAEKQTGTGKKHTPVTMGNEAP